MPIIERVAIKIGAEVSNRNHFFNLDKPVGPDEPNLFGDVILIQCLFDWILGGSGGGIRPALVSLRPPTLTGSFNAEIMNLILRYQQLERYYGFERPMRADGVIHPASFHGRTLTYGKRNMTIVQLNMDAKDATHGNAVELNSMFHLEAMLYKYQQLQFVVSNARQASSFIYGSAK